MTLTTKVLPVLKEPDFKTDMGIYDMAKLGAAAKKVNLSDVSVYTMPGEAYSTGGVSYYSPHKEALLQILNKGFVPQGVTLTLGNMAIAQKADTMQDSTNESENNLQNIIDKNQSRP